MTHAGALSEFFTTVAPRLLIELRACGALDGTDEATAEREWLAVALHACIRGVVADGPPSAEAADLVDAFHDELLARLAPGAEQADWRRRLAARYEEYDGLARTLGQKGAALVPAAIARACGRHMEVREPRELADAMAPLLEALAEGAAASLARTEGPRLPPLEGLRDIVARLEAAGIAWAVGGSGLLASLGLVGEVNDWDVQVDADPDPLRALFADVPHTFHGHGGCHADWKLAFEPQRVELIPRFAFFVPGGVVRIPFRVSRHWRGLPMASPEGWAAAYWLMGEYDEPGLRVRRASRALALMNWLAAHGADPAVVAELLREPLPIVLRDALRETH